MRSKVQLTFYLLTYYITLNILKIGVKPLGLYWGQNDTWDASRADYHTSKTSTESHSYPGYHKFVFIFEIIVSLKLYIEKSYRFNLVEIIPKGRKCVHERVQSHKEKTECSIRSFSCYGSWIYKELTVEVSNSISSKQPHYCVLLKIQPCLLSSWISCVSLLIILLIMIFLVWNVFL